MYLKPYNNPYPVVSDRLEVILETMRKINGDSGSPVETPPERVPCIGSGAFATVRVGWVQERWHSQGKNEEPGQLTFGTTAAVAVKRVVVPGKLRSPLDGCRQRLLRELQVMEHIRICPHPNVVQCWGFVFHKADDRASIGREVTDNLLGEVLTNFSQLREQQRVITGNMDKEKIGNEVLDGVSCFDVCLSLCTGGTLTEYVRRVADAALRATRACIQERIVTQPKNTSMTDSTLGESPTGHNQGLTSSSSDAGIEPKGALLGLKTRKLTPIRKDVSGEFFTQKDSTLVVSHLTIREKDIVAIAYALCNALRHTHETLRTLHRDIKPANVLICDGIGKIPSYTSRATSCDFTARTTARARGAPTELENKKANGSKAVELVLFSDLRDALGNPQEGGSADDKLTPDVLVVPAEAGSHRVLCNSSDSPPYVLECLPQVDAWRLQLADYGIASGLDHMEASGRCGTFPFMAPEVEDEDCTGSMYGTKADIYSLGVTIQHVIVNATVEFNEVAQALPRRADALGRQWVDGEDRETSEVDNDSGTSGGVTDETKRKRTFNLPGNWRCKRELSDRDYVRDIYSHLSHPLPHDDCARSFTVPRSWRCHDELASGNCVEGLSTDGRTDTGNAGDKRGHLQPQNSDYRDNIKALNFRKGQGARCRSCGKLHRNLIELLNAMTAPDPSQRPTLSCILRDTAVIEQGTFVDEPRESSFPFSRSSSSSKHANAVANTSGRSNTINSTACSPKQLSHTSRGTAPSPMAGRNHRSSCSGECKDQKTHDGSSEMFGGVNKYDGWREGVLWRPPSLKFLRRYSGQEGRC
ncbi:protein kinase, putative [Trypanosoma brucei gambiense DAL972]|uniref:Protein kinase, putative n=1 Tax=Trypanosoma brucei gambiense (strain MHOM/CI/86/DAL972) TaxID=679716 RepID=D0A0T1_TRYB9|nr:protein kinase, putative [Trypanosoma brucei gambiense DAL972]CBH16839.1 protein kinase, putative [Trypanosoma brucei gambiense DAL972]|eukprot:XP_011779103.1 protein kinase, putative [Trypanosoma brucei gambiense DAL972]